MRKLSSKTKTIAIFLGFVVTIGICCVYWGLKSKATPKYGEPKGTAGQGLMYRQVIYKDYNPANFDPNNQSTWGTKLGTYIGSGIAAWQRFEGTPPSPRGEVGLGGIMYIKPNGKIRLLIPWSFLTTQQYYMCGLGFVSSFTGWKCGSDFMADCDFSDCDLQQGNPNKTDASIVSGIDIRQEISER